MFGDRQAHCPLFAHPWRMPCSSEAATSLTPIRQSKAGNGTQANSQLYRFKYRYKCIYSIHNIHIAIKCYKYACVNNLQPVPGSLGPRWRMPSSSVWRRRSACNRPPCAPRFRGQKFEYIVVHQMSSWYGHMAKQNAPRQKSWWKGMKRIPPWAVAEHISCGKLDNFGVPSPLEVKAVACGLVKSQPPGSTYLTIWLVLPNRPTNANVQGFGPVEVCFILRACQSPKANPVVTVPSTRNILIPLKGIVCVHIVETSTATC